MIGTIPSNLPHFETPKFLFSWSMMRQLTTGSLAIAVLGLLEAVAMAKSIAARTRQKLDINQQCMSEGLANLVGSFFQCFPGSGSLTRSAINVQAGAVSQWSGVFAAIAVALTMVLFADFARYVPRATLAGLLLVSAWRLVDRKQLMHHSANDAARHANGACDGDFCDCHQYRVLHPDRRLHVRCTYIRRAARLQMAGWSRPMHYS